MNFFEELKKDVANAKPAKKEQELSSAVANVEHSNDKKANNDSLSLDVVDELYVYDKIEKKYRPVNEADYIEDKQNETQQDIVEVILSKQAKAEERENNIVRNITFYCFYFLACFAVAFIIWSAISEKKSYKNIDALRLMVENEKARIKLEKLENGEDNPYRSVVGSMITDQEIAAILNGSATESGVADELEDINPEEADSQSEYYELLSIKNAPRELKTILKDRRTFYSEQLSEYNQLYTQNNDFAGWLDVPGTAISYPIMKTSDNDFYLTHNFDKKKDKFGMLTMDFRCPLDDTGSQYIIYGHNVRDGRLFGELLNFKNESFYRYEPAIMFDTPFVRGMYEVFAVVIIQVKPGSRPEYEYINWTDEANFEKYVSQMKERSLYECKFQPKYGQPILAMVTCEKSTDTGRLVVLAGKNDMQE